jgi:hypothetical protein
MGAATKGLVVAGVVLAVVAAGCGKDRDAPSAPYGCPRNGCPSGMQIGGTPAPS